jgi:four helix bundle protein
MSGEWGAGSGEQGERSGENEAKIMKEALFRFENMEIWQRAADVSHPLFKLADKLDERRYYRFAEQLRAAALSITNNIAEGSGSVSDADFENFLNTARRSVFEVANMLILFAREGYLLQPEITPLLAEVAERSRMIYSFRQSLKS